MCGIIGQINQKEPIDVNTFIEMRDNLAHRGPDGAGIKLLSEERVALGHRRLAIIDLSDLGHQPISNEDGTIWITYNGEIYNYLKLRRDLETRGHIFRSQTDTEVIVHSYEEWGVECVNKFEGMFAFGLWDESNKRLFLARDRFGIKPLYYWNNRDRFIFASEIKGIVANRLVPRELDHNSVCNFMLYGYVPSPKSIWKNIYKLPPAHILILDRNGEIRTSQYWSISIKKQSISESEAIETVEAMLQESIKAHLISDVPVGVNLSGGIDSSSLVYYATQMKNHLQSFTIGFSDQGENSEHFSAKKTADLFKTTHHEKVISSDYLNLELAEKIAWYYDEPLASSSTLPTYLISQMASKHVKVVLGGDGGDEIFAGYKWYSRYINYFTNRSFLRKVIDSIPRRGMPLEVRIYGGLMTRSQTELRNQDLQNLLSPEFIKSIPKEEFWLYKQYYNPKIGTIKAIQAIDLNTFLPEECLTKVDRASMANSLEVRVPFLDHKLVEYMFSLPENIYFKNNEKKYLLKTILNNKLPNSILHKPKQGFGSPVAQLLSKQAYKDLLINSRIVESNITSQSAIKSMIEKNEVGKLWTLVVFELWCQQWLK